MNMNTINTTIPSLSIYEIFFSLQGESSFSGLPCTFVRLAGCPLNCRWCDTHIVRTAPGQRMTIDEILQQVESFHCSLVELTGGEPLAQPETPQLLDALLQEKYTVLLETSGAFSLKRVPADVHIIFDMKPPSSGEHMRMLEQELARLGPGDEVKFPVANRMDFDAALQCLQRWPQRTFAVLFSPVTPQLSPGELAQWILDARVMDARLQIQLHKVAHFA